VGGVSEYVITLEKPVTIRLGCIAAAILCLSVTLAAQTASTPAPDSASVPKVIRFSGSITVPADSNAQGVVLAPGAAPTHVVAITFSLYAEQSGGAPLWSEVQNVHVDSAGRYTVQLGATKPDGLPMDIFTSVQAQWLGVQPQGQAEQARVLLVSVPYALKSGDAETFGGLPPSAFMKMPSVDGTSGSTQTTGSTGNTGKSGGGIDTVINCVNAATGYLPLFTQTRPPNITICNSAIYQNPTTAKLGIGTTTPGGKFEVIDNNPNDVDHSFVINATTNVGTAAGVSGQNFDTVMGIGVTGHVQGASGTGVLGFHDNLSGLGAGVTGLTNSSSGMGVSGIANTATGSAYGVSGASASNDGIGVIGVVTSGGAQGHQSFGVEGQAHDPNGAGGSFANLASSGKSVGMSAITDSSTGTGVYGVGLGASQTGQMFGNLTTVGVWGDAANGIGIFATSDDSTALLAVNNSPTGAALGGVNKSTSGVADGVAGTTVSPAQNASGVYGEAMAATGATNGVFGQTDSSDTNADGVYGKATSTSGSAKGVYGVTASKNGTAIYGIATSTDSSGSANGVYGQSATGIGVYGYSTWVAAGVLGVANDNNADCCSNGVFGANLSTSGHNNGGELTTASPGGVGGILENTGGGLSILARVNSSQNSFWVDGGGNGWFNGALQVNGGGSSFGGAVTINGNLQINGNLSKLSGSFKIDDPLDPANKYLSHSFVESPDMMNIYNGIARLDARGQAWVELPQYFEALNRDFRYQLTSIGASQPRLYIAREVGGNRFKIAGGKPGAKVSWQVTGIRQDAWANAHRIPNEEDKPLEKRGTYLYSEPYEQDSNKNASAMLQH